MGRVGREGGGEHVRTKLAQRLIEVVHLCQDADYHDNAENVGGGGGELVVAAESHLNGDAEALDGHDGDGADSAADAEVNHWILLTVQRRDAVDHDEGEERHNDAVEEEACLRV